MTPSAIKAWNAARSPLAAPMGAFPVQPLSIAQVDLKAFSAASPPSRRADTPVELGSGRTRAAPIPLSAPPAFIRVLSLGAGVQSTTLALMAAAGEAPMPDAAIFADTGWEPAGVYEHLAWLETQLPFPIHRVSKGNLRADVIASTNTTGQRFASVPFFTSDKNGIGMGRRQCTKEYKLEPIWRKLRELAGPSRKAKAEMLIGISTDEAIRMKPSRRQWITNRWPLIEMGMSRQDCLRWMETRGYPKPPKSSCIGCPYHSDLHWREMRDGAPEEWADAVMVDGLIRDGGRQRGIRAQQFMHRSCVPLDRVDLRTHAERGQPDLFGNECEGMCGI